jgi:uncharacterized protein (TIGR02594 family)
MKLPQQYAWLADEAGPKMLTESLKLVGVKEVVGPLHNDVILGWARELGIEKIYTNDELAWCGLAHALIIKRSDKPLSLKSYDLLRALKYVNFGTPVSKAMLGDTLIFQREGGGHVGLYVGEDSVAYHVLGGNQANQYGFTRIAKDRLFGIRRPHYNNQPANVRVVQLSKTGSLSYNEA